MSAGLEDDELEDDELEEDDFEDDDFEDDDFEDDELLAGAWLVWVLVDWPRFFENVAVDSNG